MRQTFKDFEIMVIDNGSTDATPFLLEKYPVKVIRDATKILPYLFNLGWRNALADIVAYVSDDAEADSSWLENIADTFAKFKDVHVVGGPTVSMRKQEMLSLYEDAQRSKLLDFIARTYNTLILEGRFFEIGALCQSGAYSVGGVLPQSSRLKEPIYVDLLTTANVAIKKAVFYKIGGFDENFLFHFDGDFWIKMKRNGYKLLFSPRVIVWHYVSALGASRAPYYISRDYAIFFMKDFHPKTSSGKLRLFLNILCFNAFWIFKTFKTRNVGFLNGIKGFIIGVIDYFKIRNRYR